MIDYEEFCAGHERATNNLQPPQCEFATYVEAYLNDEKAGNSEAAGYWAGRLAKLRESDRDR